MNNAGLLNDRPKTELAALARRRGISGWEAMNKGELLKALTRVSAKSVPTNAKAAKPSKLGTTAKTAVVAKPANQSAPAAKPAARITTPATRPLPKPAAKAAAKVTRPAKPVAAPAKRQPIVASGRSVPPATNGSHRPVDATTPNAAKAKLKVSIKPAVKPTGKSASKPEPIAAKTPARETPRDSPKLVPGGPSKDRIFIAVPDPHWLHVIWEVTNQSVQRAEAALKQDWYGAKMIIRLSDVTSHDTTSTSETPLRDIVVQPDCNTWYINVAQPPRQYRVDIGYLSRRGDFFPLAKSNVATPPKAGTSEPLDPPWAMGDPKQAERTLARSSGFESAGNPELREFFEERLKRSLGAPKETGFGSGATPPGSMKKFFFDIDARLVVYGRTDPSAHLTLGNDPVSLKTDGTFAMWFSLPDSRQIIPAVATSSDGVEERTIVLAVERNTKYLDPMIHDQMNEI